jgi:SAM-dependent methyltransferase
MTSPWPRLYHGAEGRKSGVRPVEIATLKPQIAGPVPCKICGAAAPVVGAVDFNKSCEEPHGTYLPPSWIEIHYRRCGDCGFLFTDCFDEWSVADFAAHIYNADYARIDPESASHRPLFNARELLRAFAAAKSRLRVLDYGGGAGVLAQALRDGGFAAAETYDPLVAAHAALPAGRFDLVTCYETLEHHPRPLAAIREMAERTAPDGMVMVSTLVQPDDFARQGLRWWYVGPRNGHISLFTYDALDRAWRGQGMRMGVLDQRLHVAFRAIPDFARHLFKLEA